MYYVYVIQNDRGRIYIGQTNNLIKRLDRHNGVLLSNKRAFTSLNRDKGIWKVRYQEPYNTRAEAMAREKYLKSHIGRDWIRSQIMAR